MLRRIPIIITGIIIIRIINNRLQFMPRRCMWHPLWCHLALVLAGLIMADITADIAVDTMAVITGAGAIITVVGGNR